jgi:broad specificity phosphatase PhoE
MAGQRIREYITKDGEEPKLYFYMSPYKRSLQTFEALASNFTRGQIKGCQEEVQLREQDFGNFQVITSPRPPLPLHPFLFLLGF